MGNIPTQCENDPASVLIQVTSGQAECLVASSINCKIHSIMISGWTLVWGFGLRLYG